MEENKIEQETIEDTKVEPVAPPIEEPKFDYKDPDYKRRKKRASIISVCIVVSLIVLFTLAIVIWFFIINYPVVTVTHEFIDDLKVDYTLSEDGCYVKDINYDDYLKDVNPSDLFYKKIYLSQEEGVSEENSAAQNNETIQNIINAQDGAIIYVDGNYKVQSIELKSKTTLIIQKDCSLIGPTYSDKTGSKAVVWAKDAKNINIYGPGTIEGNGESFTKNAKDSSILTPLNEFNVKTRVLEARKRIREAKDDKTRPHIILLENCSNVNIQSVRLHEAAFWTLCVRDSNDVLIQDIVIDNNVHVANADGIDLVSSQRVKVLHCFIATADDGVCVKSSGSENSEDITVNRCSIMSMANNFKIGTETPNDIKNISVTNSYFFMPDNVVGGYSGVAIESADGADVYNVYVDNIIMRGISAPVLVWLGDRLKNGSDGKVGSITKVTISNITATDVELSSAITGCTHLDNTYYVKDVTIANFNVTYRNTGEALNVGEANYEPSMNDYPEITRVLHLYMFSHENSKYFDMPTYGLFARHVDKIKVYNLNVTPRSCSELPRDNITQVKDRYDVLNVRVD